MTPAVHEPGAHAPELDEVLEQERRIMDSWAAHYDVATLSAAYVYRNERSEFARWMAATVRAAGRDPGALSVLDVGCGTGTVLEQLAREGFGQLTGVDLSQQMLAQARRRSIPGARWVQAPIERASFEPASFDVVLASFTLHHLRDPRSFFELVDSTLRAGGWFFILEYDRAAKGRGGRRGAPLARAAAGLPRGLFARKNRRRLAALPTLERLFNPAHRLLTHRQVLGAMTAPDLYSVHREPRGVLRPVLLPVLVEESALDRGVSRALAALDRHLAPRAGGVFQWVAGRRIDA